MLYYDLNGKPMETQTYQLAMKTDTSLAMTKLWFGQLTILTRWTGLDMSHRPDQPPQIFETMVLFRDKSIDIEHYATVDEALFGHHYWSRFYRSPNTIIKTFVPAIE